MTEHSTRTWPRIIGRATAFGILAATLALGWGPLSAAGAAAGALAAGLYVTAFLQSHLSDPAGGSKPADRKVVRSSMVRLGAATVAGFAAYLAGRHVVIAYVASSAAAFPLLVLGELGRIRSSMPGRKTLQAADRKAAGAS